MEQGSARGPACSQAETGAAVTVYGPQIPGQGCSLSCAHRLADLVSQLKPFHDGKLTALHMQDLESLQQAFSSLGVEIEVNPRL